MKSCHKDKLLLTKQHYKYLKFLEPNLQWNHNMKLMRLILLRKENSKGNKRIVDHDLTTPYTFIFL